MGGHKSRSCSGYATPTKPIPAKSAYACIGNGNPNPNGLYYLLSEHDGKPSYYSKTGWFLWWSEPGEAWVINKVIGIATVGYFIRILVGIEGIYNPGGLYTGNPQIFAHIE